MTDPAVIQKAQETLSIGALSKLFGTAQDNFNKGGSGKLNQDDFPGPLNVQVLLIKEIPAGDSIRARMTISDGANHVNAMTNSSVTEYLLKEATKESFFSIDNFLVKYFPSKRTWILIVNSATKIDELPPMPLPSRSEPLKFDIYNVESHKSHGGGTTNATTVSGNSFYGNNNNDGVNQSDVKGVSKPAGNVCPIETVTPYQNKWTIKARVSVKSEVRHYHNQRGEGKLFNVTFLDETGEIRATGFNQQVDQFYDLLQEGQVYYVSNCRVNMAKKQFSNVNNAYELMFERDSKIEKALDTQDVPQQKFNFTRVADIASVDPDSVIDVIGVVQNVAETAEIVSKNTNKQFTKREIGLVDDSDFMVNLTLWGQSALKFEAKPGTVLAFKGVKVSSFNGRSLSALQTTSMITNPEINEAFTLSGWSQALGTGLETKVFNSLNTLVGPGDGVGNTGNDRILTLAQVKKEKLGQESTGKADYFTVKGTISFIRQNNLTYPACPNSECNKKVTMINDDEWRCEKCDKTYKSPHYRYIMTFAVGDHTDHIWMSCFDQVGEIIMGMSADDYVQLGNNNNNKQEQGMFVDGDDDEDNNNNNNQDGGDQSKECGEARYDACSKSYTFRCRAREESYNDSTVVRYQVVSAQPLDYAQECKRLIDAIQL